MTKEEYLGFYRMQLEEVVKYADQFIAFAEEHIAELDKPAKEDGTETYNDQLMIILTDLMHEAASRALVITTSLIGRLTKMRKAADTAKTAAQAVNADEMAYMKTAAKLVDNIPSSTFVGTLRLKEDSMEPLLAKENSFPVHLKNENSFPPVDGATITVKPDETNNWGRKPYSFPWPRKKEEPK